MAIFFLLKRISSPAGTKYMYLGLTYWTSTSTSRAVLRQFPGNNWAIPGYLNFWHFDSNSLPPGQKYYSNIYPTLLATSSYSIPSLRRPGKKVTTKFIVVLSVPLHIFNPRVILYEAIKCRLPKEIRHFILLFIVGFKIFLCDFPSSQFVEKGKGLRRIVG